MTERKRFEKWAAQYVGEDQFDMAVFHNVKDYRNGEVRKLRRYWNEVRYLARQEIREENAASSANQ
jgi:hypothetical protein